MGIAIGIGILLAVAVLIWAVRKHSRIRKHRAMINHLEHYVRGY